MEHTLLIVDDESDIVLLIKDHFEYSGYQVLTALNGEEAIRQAERQPDLILLDINMPDLDGLEVCKHIRHVVTCPIVFVSARVEDSDKILGLQVGGDDYIVKPFSLEELSARVEAHIRRDQRQLKKSKIRLTNEIQIDYDAKTIWFHNKELGFTKKEFDIIELLSTYRGQVFDKERIYEKLWGFNGDGDSSVVTEHIRKIRAKFLKYGVKQPIQTVWGVGYRWVN